MSNKTEQILNGLESPFLSNELFADESSVEAPAFSSSVLDESPFLQGFAENFLAPASLEEQYYAEEFEDAQAFREGDDEEQDEEWRDIEYDSPTTSSLATPDSLLAIPAFTPAKRATIGKPLMPAASRAAIRWNAGNHPRKSGVSPDSILAALQSYVDLSAVNSAIASYNSQNPSAPVKPGTKPVDAVFVEAMAQTNEWAKRRVRSGRKGIEEALSTSTDLTKDLTQSNWWSSFVNPCFLGWEFVRPIHVYFARKLRKAELWLLSQSRFAGATPIELATLLEIDEKHAGGRSESGSKSIHTLGLGIDVKYKGNPHVGDYRDKPRGAKRFSEVMKRAAAKISGLTLADEKFPQYLNKLGTDTSKATGQIYDELVQRDQDLRTYLARAEASADLAALRKGVFKGRVDRDPLKGFLNLDRDLVIALRDHACLIWGAVDLGPSSSGDIMHFDCRLDDLGRAVYCGTGGTFNDKHPCWKRSEPPCPQSTGRPGRVRQRDGEILDSECEDDSVAELEEVAEEVFIEYSVGADDEFTEEFEKTDRPIHFYSESEAYVSDDEAEDAELDSEVRFTDTGAYEYDSDLFEMFAPKVSQTDLRKRIDEYFELANAEYVLPKATKIWARPQFHFAKAGDPEQDAQAVEKMLEKKFGNKFTTPLQKAIRCAAYGRARPDEIKVITQALIEAGELDTLRSNSSGLSDNQLVRALQQKFNIGIDCAGYVQLAFIYAFTGKHDDAICNLGASKLREDLGLKPKRSWENLANLPKKHFTEVGFLNGQTGDLLVLAWRKEERDWHTVIVVEHTFSGDLHTFVVDSSWGFLYGPDAAGVARRTFMHDKSTGMWWDIHPINKGTKKEFENLIGPYNEHPIKGMYRAKQKK